MAASVLMKWMSTIGTILLYAWPLLIGVWLIFLYVRWKKWPIEVIIIEKRGNNLIKTNDRGGRYYDKFSGINGYKLQKMKDTIPIYDFDWILHNVAVPTTFFDRFVNLIRGNSGTILLFKYGSKQYKPIKIKEGNNVRIDWGEMKDKDGSPIIFNTYLPLDPRDKLGNIEFEVVDWDNMNFMIQEQRASIERRKRAKEWLLTMAIPAIMIVGAVIIGLFILKFSYDYGIELRGTTLPPDTTQNTNPNIPVIGDLIPGS